MRGSDYLRVLAHWESGLPIPQHRSRHISAPLPPTMNPPARNPEDVDINEQHEHIEQHEQIDPREEMRRELFAALMPKRPWEELKNNIRERHQIHAALLEYKREFGYLRQQLLKNNKDAMSNLLQVIADKHPNLRNKVNDALAHLNE